MNVIYCCCCHTFCFFPIDSILNDWLQYLLLNFTAAICQLFAGHVISLCSVNFSMTKTVPECAQAGGINRKGVEALRRRKDCFYEIFFAQCNVNKNPRSACKLAELCRGDVETDKP